MFKIFLAWKYHINTFKITMFCIYWFINMEFGKGTNKKDVNSPPSRQRSVRNYVLFFSQNSLYNYMIKVDVVYL